MKKIIYLLSFIMLIMLIPSEAIYAKPVHQDEHMQHMSHLKEKRQIIKQHVKEQKKITAHINKMSKKIADTYNKLFKDDMAPNDEQVRQIEEKEMEITKVVKQLIRIEKQVARLNKQINMNLQQEAYEQALSNMDKIIDLMEKKTELLKLHHADLMAYLEFLQSLKLK